jgi:hypothetical protein
MHFAPHDVLALFSILGCICVMESIDVEALTLAASSTSRTERSMLAERDRLRANLRQGERLVHQSEVTWK